MHAKWATAVEAPDAVQKFAVQALRPALASQVMLAVLRSLATDVMQSDKQLVLVCACRAQRLGCVKLSFKKYKSLLENHSTQNTEPTAKDLATPKPTTK